MGKIDRLPGVSSARTGRCAGRSPSACKDCARVRAAARRTPSCASRARAAWIAASRSATPAARSTTSSPTGTTSCTAAAGTKRSTCCTRPTTSPSSPAASARRRARPRACSASTSDPVTIKLIEQADRRPALGRGLDRARAAAAQDRQAGRGRRLRPRRPGRGAAARARRSRRRRCSSGGPHRRPAPLRHPRLQDGEAPHRPAHGADGGRGRRRSGTNANVGVNVTRAELRAEFDAIVLAGGASSRATCRCRAASSRASTSRWSSCRSRTSACAGDERAATQILGHGQARHHHRRRRHRARLPRHLASGRARKSVHQFELMPQPPERGGQGAHLALLAAHAAHLVARTKRAASATSPSSPSVRRPATARSRTSPPATSSG